MRDTGVVTAWRFGAVVVVTVLVLGILNALPQFFGGEPLGVVRYATIQEAEARLGARLYRPAALPDGWTAAPAGIRLAVGRPDWIEFVYAADGAFVTLCQTLGDARLDRGAVPPVLLPRGEVLQASDLTVAGRSVRMQRVLLDDGAIAHELWWRKGARRVMLRARVAADSLPRIARAIVGE